MANNNKCLTALKIGLQVLFVLMIIGAIYMIVSLSLNISKNHQQNSEGMIYLYILNILLIQLG